MFAPSAIAEISQETLALSKRLFLQLKRRPSTLVAGILQPLIWLVLFGALFAKAPMGLFPGGGSYGKFLGAGVIVFTAFSAALNAGLPVMFDREFGFLNRLLVAPLRSRYSIVLASVLYITSLSLVQSLAIMAAAWGLGYGWPGGGRFTGGDRHPAATGGGGYCIELGSGFCFAWPHRIDCGDFCCQLALVICKHCFGPDQLHAWLVGLACSPKSPYLRD